MYFNALPAVVKNAAAPLSQVDRITMYGEGNSSKLVGDIIGSTTKITDGLTEATGIDLRALLAGFLGGKMADFTTAKKQAELAEQNQTDDDDSYIDDEEDTEA
jgi:flotillin